MGPSSLDQYLYHCSPCTWCMAKSNYLATVGRASAIPGTNPFNFLISFYPLLVRKYSFGSTWKNLVPEKHSHWISFAGLDDWWTRWSNDLSARERGKEDQGIPAISLPWYDPHQEAYVDEKARTQYNPSNSSFLSKFGASLTIDSRLGGIFHVRGNHWLPITIDITTEELLYGDPAGSTPESEVISALRWFVAKHSSLPFDQLDEEALPYVKQHV